MDRIVLQNGDMRVALLSYGAITQGWWMRDVPLILGYDDPDAYRTGSNFAGAIVGRLANRVSGARFTLDGQNYGLTPNEGPHQLHGGAQGFWTRDWSLDQTGEHTARLTYHSPDGEGGYPGAVDVTVTVQLDPDALTYRMEARPDRPTPLSLAQHNYYCLGASDGARAVQVAADAVLGVTEALIPTGALAPVAGSPLDLRTMTDLGPQGPKVDHFYVFDAGRDPAQPVALVRAPSGLALTAFTDQPGAQVYTGHGLASPFAPCAGLCFEPSGYPDAVNQTGFPSVIATPDAPYRQTLRLVITEGHR